MYIRTYINIYICTSIYTHIANIGNTLVVEEIDEMLKSAKGKDKEILQQTRVTYMTPKKAKKAREGV